MMCAACNGSGESGPDQVCPVCLGTGGSPAGMDAELEDLLVDLVCASESAAATYERGGGHTGEGAVAEARNAVLAYVRASRAEVERLRALVEEAWREGYHEAECEHDTYHSTRDDRLLELWIQSDAHKFRAAQPGEVEK